MLDKVALSRIAFLLDPPRLHSIHFEKHERCCHAVCHEAEVEAFWHEAGVRGGSDSACLPFCLHFFLSCSLRACRSGDPCFQVDWAAARKVPMPRLMQQSFDDWNILKSLHLEML